MGYRPVRRSYALRFPTGSDLHGLEITVKALTLGEFRVIQAEQTRQFEEKTPLEERQDYEISEFVARVEAWNLEDDAGRLMPIGVAALRELNYSDVQDILQVWFRKAYGADVSAPLDGRSDDGGSSGPTASMEESLPMVVLPGSPPS